MGKGTYKFIPFELLEEFEVVRKECPGKQTDAFRKIAENARIGRQIKRMTRFEISIGVKK